jgi:hypothetical protein
MFKSFWKVLVITLFGLSLILYITSIGEGMENLRMEGSYLENVPRTLEYFFLWVLPYWWFILLTAGTITAAGLTIINRKKAVRR